MPNRIIKETICSSDNLNRLEAEAENLFYRLMVQADDFGRFDARPAIIRAACFPLKLDIVSEQSISSWLIDLVAAELIFIYEINDRRYLQFVKWDRHQQRRASKSKFPDPTECSKVDTHDYVYQQPQSSDINCNQLQSNVPVIVIENRESNAEPETEPKLKKTKYAEFVSMTEAERIKLVDKYGEADTVRLIEILNNYKGSTGKKYRSDYLTILNWVVDKLAELKAKEKVRQPRAAPSPSSRDPAAYYDPDPNGEDGPIM